MKCARKACNRTGVAKHSETGAEYCFRCARAINDAAQREVVLLPARDPEKLMEYTDA